MTDDERHGDNRGTWPAFPTHGVAGDDHNADGLTIREWMAVQALSVYPDVLSETTGSVATQMGEFAVAVADATLAALAKVASSDQLPGLTSEERAAINVLHPGLIERILRGQRTVAEPPSPLADPARAMAIDVCRKLLHHYPNLDVLLGKLGEYAADIMYVARTVLKMVDGDKEV